MSLFQMCKIETAYYGVRLSIQLSNKLSTMQSTTPWPVAAPNVITYIFPFVFAEGQAVRDQILKEIFMGDGLASSVEAELGMNRWTGKAGKATVAHAIHWLTKNPKLNQEGRLEEPAQVDENRKWATWLINVVIPAREEVSLKEQDTSFNYQPNCSDLDMASSNSNGSFSALNTIVLDQQKQIETLTALVDNMVMAYTCKPPSWAPSSNTWHRQVKHREVTDVVNRYRTQLYVKADEAYDNAMPYETLDELHTAWIAKAPERASMSSVDDLRLFQEYNGKVCASVTRERQRVADIAAAEKKEIVAIEQAIKFAEDVRIARREAARCG